MKSQKIEYDKDLETQNYLQEPCFEIGKKMAEKISQNQLEGKSFNDAYSYASFLDDSGSHQLSGNLNQM
jgi:hypothetical protein